MVVVVVGLTQSHANILTGQRPDRGGQRPWGAPWGPTGGPRVLGGGDCLVNRQAGREAALEAPANH